MAENSNFFDGNAADVMEWLRANDVEKVRVEYSDLAGIARGKGISREHFPSVMRTGVPFCAAIYAADVEANIIPGTDYAETIGYGDIISKPDISTLRVLRHVPNTALCVAENVWPDGRPAEADPRQVLSRVVGDLETMGYRAYAAPELEFYILDENYEPIGDGYQAYSMHHRHSFHAEEEALLDAVAAHGPFEASGHEYGPGQYEVTIPYGEIRAIADFGHLFRTTMKEVALDIGRRVTFMAKPVDGMAGSSCHLHLSLRGEDGAFIFSDPDKPHGISDTCRHFMGGVLDHMEELMAIYFPNINSYRRLVPGLFAPYSQGWGVDNRTVAIRVLNDEPEATRIELRLCGGDINLYAAMAGLLAAGIDGMRRETDPGPAFTGDVDEQEVPRVPDNWGRALDSFEGSKWIAEALGADFQKCYSIVKRAEYAKIRRTVTDVERQMYLEFL
jgi:glutamine synthetase